MPLVANALFKIDRPEDTLEWTHVPMPLHIRH